MFMHVIACVACVDDAARRGVILTGSNPDSSVPRANIIYRGNGLCFGHFYEATRV